MRHARLFLAVLLLAAPLAHGAEPAAKQFLRYIYGAEGINLADISGQAGQHVEDRHFEKGETAAGILLPLTRPRMIFMKPRNVDGYIASFPKGQPLPLALIKRIVRYKIKQDLAKAGHKELP